MLINTTRSLGVRSSSSEHTFQTLLWERRYVLLTSLDPARDHGGHLPSSQFGTKFQYQSSECSQAQMSLLSWPTAAFRGLCTNFQMKIMENKEKISRQFHKLGFTYISLDLDGFKSGSLNAVLN